MNQPSCLFRTLYGYLNNPPTIRNIVVDCTQDAYEDRAISKLSKDRAKAEVRQAVNRWYYNHKVGQ